MKDEGAEGRGIVPHEAGKIGPSPLEGVGQPAWRTRLNPRLPEHHQPSETDCGLLAQERRYRV